MQDQLYDLARQLGGRRGRRSLQWAEGADPIDVIDQGAELDEVVERLSKHPARPAAVLRMALIEPNEEVD